MLQIDYKPYYNGGQDPLVHAAPSEAIIFYNEACSDCAVYINELKLATGLVMILLGASILIWFV